ncbi:inner nuclear membrane protein enriched at telomere/subtelomere region [Mortierella alpina]|nr:inner nuclear membrane protein enriched at telomere/subtelomere region [Mortierella alpina]
MPPKEHPHYLHPDFDPWTLKMDQIREILIQHHVRTPTGIVKKQQLVDLFNENIKPQVPEFKDAEKKVKAEEHKEGPSTPKARQPRRTKTEEKLVEEPSLTKPARIRRASSKARLNAEESVEVVVPKPKRSNSRVKASPVKSDAESSAAEPVRGRRPRKASVESEDDYAPKTKSPKAAAKVKKAKGDNFSDENPFQSGSERGRSTSRDTTRSRSRSRQSTKRTPKVNDKTTARDSAFKVPAQPAFSKFMHAPPKDKDSETSSRSSTALARARRLSTSELPPPKPLHLTSSQPDIHEFLEKVRRNLTAIWIVLGAISLVYGVWYRQTRIEVGFCTPTSDLATRAGGWFYPSCIPCPDHAICERSDAEPVCPPEYMLKPQLLSFGNLLPLSPVCVLNKAKAYQSLQVADAAEKLLHLHAGKIECSMTRDPVPKDSVEYRARRGASTLELRQQLEQLKDANVSQDDFDQYWDRALRELRRRSDKVVFETGLAGEERIRSLRPRKSLGCRLRQLLVGWIVEFKFILFALLSTALGGLYVRSYMERRQKETMIVNGLVQNVLAKLSDQAHYFYVDPVIYPEPWLSDAHLRDALLADVPSPARRQEIWQKVHTIVENNANVRASDEDMRGEVHRTWEWIGATGVLGQQHQQPRHQEVASSGSSTGFAVPTVKRGRGRPPKVPPRVGAHGSFFGMTRQDSEYMNPENSLYPSLSQEYQSFSQE